MPPTGRTFTIRSIRDLLDVPADRLPVCLAELEGWIAQVRQYALTRGMPASIGPYIWHDDGTAGFTVERREQETPGPFLFGLGYLHGSPNDTRARFRDMSVREQHRRLRGNHL